MTGTKSAIKSKGLWATGLGLLITVLGFFGINITPADAELMGVHLEQIIAAVLFLLGFVGRYVAKDEIV